MSNHTGIRPTLAELKTIAKWLSAWALAVGFTITFIRQGPDRVYETYSEPSPFGYTASLSIVLFTLVPMVFWYLNRRTTYFMLPALARALVLKVAFISVGWILLDVLLANVIFVFPDESATIGVRVPGYIWGNGFECNIPIEEVIFYILSVAAVNALYLWTSEEWFRRYSVVDVEFREKADALKGHPLVHFNCKIVLIGVAVLLLGVMFKKGWPHGYNDGWPYYFFALVFINVVPVAALYDRVKVFPNTRALVSVLPMHILVSLIWEVTLALPYGWWHYRRSAMLGVFIEPWSDLPIEAVGLWLSVGVASIFTYEASRVKAYLGLPWRKVLFG